MKTALQDLAGCLYFGDSAFALTMVLNKKTIITLLLTALTTGLAGYFAGRKPVSIAMQDSTGTQIAAQAQAHLTRHHHNGFPAVTIEPSVVQNLGVRTARAEIGEMSQSIETIGKITRVDQTARRIITPPIDGQLAYLADKYPGDDVRQGELLFSIASTPLFEQERRFQEAFLAGETANADTALAALNRQGLNPEQIAKLQAGARPELPVEVYAREAGYIFARRGTVGEPVNTGFTVFNIGGNYRVVEVTAEIFERQWGKVEEGQRAFMSVRGLPGIVFEGRVVRVEPPVGFTTRSLEVRLKFKTDNPELTQSLFARIKILDKSRKKVLMVPQEAVIRTADGERVVVVRADGLYQPVAVLAGEASAGRVEIRSGLDEGAVVVASGQFLIDSESNLQAELLRMAATGTMPRSVHQH
ncbi:MAG: hypothetical protein CVV13_02235 [Gammaproteobacteria bacterium HGW-Gammaproteobacteria-3]|nr:MAG: hypothetical protein CVV13_02235 [Gammaproteobacteria bacterium HGW-Gammaproteobacteria-3]